MSKETKPSYQDIQKEESKTWLISDPKIFADKRQREIVRYPMMAKQMGLNFLDTSDMSVVDVGCGPFGGVSSVLRTRQTFRVDPLAKDYATIGDKNIVDAQAETFDYGPFDLVIATNCIDHFEDPHKFLERIKETMHAGAYFAQFHAIDNATTHPHPAHVHNINPNLLHEYLDTDFETVWELTYPEVRYAWVNYKGKVGQPAFCGLYRKVTGYGK